MNKTCIKCDETKELAQFYKRGADVKTGKVYGDGYATICRACHLEANSKPENAKPKQADAHSRGHISANLLESRVIGAICEAEGCDNKLLRNRTWRVDKRFICTPCHSEQFDQS